MTFPDTRDCTYDILNGQQFAGHQVFVCYRLPGDYLDTVKDGTLAVLLYPLGGTEGAVDHVDRVGIDVYGVGTDSMDVAKDIHDELAPSPWTANSHETPSGYVDDVQSETLPVDVPFPDPTITQTQAVYRITVRQSA